jgi:hypothetical protein
MHQRLKERGKKRTRKILNPLKENINKIPTNIYIKR